MISATQAIGGDRSYEDVGERLMHMGRLYDAKKQQMRAQVAQGRKKSEEESMTKRPSTNPSRKVLDGQELTVEARLLE